MSDAPLAGVTVLVTRPEHQAAELIDAVAASGGHVLAFPVIDIAPRSRDEIAADLATLHDPDITIFISRNAVEHGFDNAGGQVAAIGPTTAAEIAARGGNVDIVPDGGFDSEALLARPELVDVEGKVVRIVRGNAGRELLARTLTERGAVVEYLSTYERRLPDYDQDTLDEVARRWAAARMTVVVVMSVQSLHNLVALLPDAGERLLPESRLVTPAERVLKETRTLCPGCTALLATGPRADELLDAVVAAATGRPARGQD